MRKRSHYDPKKDPRVCDLTKGDTQCDFIFRRDDGYLNCALKLGHEGDHHTTYVGRDPWPQSDWVKP